MSETEYKTRISELEKELAEQARLNGIGSEREAALMSKLAASEITIRILEGKYKYVALMEASWRPQRK